MTTHDQVWQTKIVSLVHGRRFSIVKQPRTHVKDLYLPCSLVHCEDMVREDICRAPAHLSSSLMYSSHGLPTQRKGWAMGTEVEGQRVEVA